MMGFPALSDLLASEPEPDADSAKNTLFGFPAQKAGMNAFKRNDSEPSLAEESEIEYDEGDATHLIPAAQLQREFEGTPAAAAVEAHEPRMTMAGVPVSELGGSPASIKSAWGLDEESETDHTAVVPASAIFDKEQSAKAGFSKRVETTEFPNSSTLMGMSLDDFNAALKTPAEADEPSGHSTQFAMPAIQVTPPVETPHNDDLDSGPVSGELPTQMWNPSDELDEDNVQHRELLEKIRGEAAGKAGAAKAPVDRGTAENAKPLSDGPAKGLAAGQAPKIPAPKSTGLGDPTSLRSRLQERLKGAVPEPVLKPVVVAPKPVVNPKPIAAPKPELAASAPESPTPEPILDLPLDSSELPEISMGSIVPMADASPEPKPAKEPRNLSSSGVLGSQTYVVSKKQEVPAQPIFPADSVDAAPEDDEEFAFADTSIAAPGAVIAARATTPTIGGMPPAVVREPTPAPMPAPAQTSEPEPAPASQPAITPSPALTPARESASVLETSPTPQADAPHVPQQPEILVFRLQQLFGFFGFALVAASVAINVLSVGGLIFALLFAVFAGVLAAITFAPIPAAARNVAWALWGIIIVAVATAVLAFDFITPPAGALAIGGGLASLFAGTVLNRILR